MAEFELTFKNLEKKFSNTNELVKLQQFEQSLGLFKQEVQQQKPKMVNLEKALAQKEKSIAEKIAKAKISLEKQQWQNIFSVIEDSLQQEVAFSEHNNFPTLSQAWQKRLHELTNLVKEVNRDELTLELEILSGVASPAELQQKRMSVQVSLMQEQKIGRASCRERV